MLRANLKYTVATAPFLLRFNWNGDYVFLFYYYVSLH